MVANTDNNMMKLFRKALYLMYIKKNSSVITEKINKQTKDIFMAAAVIKILSLHDIDE